MNRHILHVWKICFPLQWIMAKTVLSELLNKTIWKSLKFFKSRPYLLLKWRSVKKKRSMTSVPKQKFNAFNAFVCDLQSQGWEALKGSSAGETINTEVFWKRAANCKRQVKTSLSSPSRRFPWSSEGWGSRTRDHSWQMLRCDASNQTHLSDILPTPHGRFSNTTEKKKKNS